MVVRDSGRSSPPDESLSTGSEDVGTDEDGAASAAPGPGSIIAGGLLFLVGVALLALAISAGADYGVTLGGPTLAPIIVTGMWVVTSLAYLIGQLRRRMIIADHMSWRTPAILMATLIGYAIVLKYTVVGYVLSTAAFVLISARLLSTRPLRQVIVRDLTTAVALSVGIYLAFTRLLGISLPAGVLPL